jgi:hypothetical protein
MSKSRKTGGLMKNFIMTALVCILSTSAFAAPRLLAGPERELYIKALSASLNENRNAEYNCVTTARDGSKKSDEISAFVVVDYFASNIQGRALYLNEETGSQPVIQMTGKSSDGYNVVSSFTSDSSYKKIVGVGIWVYGMQEQNVGDLLHPNFQMVPVTVSQQSCTIKN